MFMNNRILALLILFVGLTPTVMTMPLVAFSPYENQLLSGQSQRVGLFAFVEADKVEQAKACIDDFSEQSVQRLDLAGVQNLNVFVRDLNDRSVVFAYFEYKPKGLDGLTTVLGKNCNEAKSLEKMLAPHPRAGDDQAWVRMEWINWIASDDAFPHDKKEIRTMGLISGLQPEREVTYRQLHQTNWPGVVDGMVQCNYRNWTTFLIEHGDDLFLFTYAEYIGENIDTDNQRMAADPTTQRWWKQTEPCLINLHGEGNWSAMNPW